MSTKLLIKRSDVPDRVPTTADLEIGELALNSHDGILFFKVDDGVDTYITTISRAAGAKGGGRNEVFFENDIVVTDDYEITEGKNAMSTGPLTIEQGVTITVPSESNWVIL